MSEPDPFSIRLLGWLVYAIFFTLLLALLAASGAFLWHVISCFPGGCA